MIYVYFFLLMEVGPISTKKEKKKGVRKKKDFRFTAPKRSTSFLNPAVLVGRTASPKTGNTLYKKSIGTFHMQKIDASTQQNEKNREFATAAIKLQTMK